MRLGRASLQFAAVAMVSLFIACTTTKFSVTWKDEGYQGHPKKILVINTFPNPVNRRIFEDELVKVLRDRGIDAAVSYTVMPNPVLPDENAILALGKGANADTVLVNKPVGLRNEESGGPGGIYYENFFVNTQTDVYDMNLNRVVMTASAETWVRQDVSNDTQMYYYVKDLVKKLSQLGLF